MAGIYDERILGAKQQAETARKLREGVKTPQGQMVGDIYVAPAWTQYLAEGLKAYGAGREERDALALQKQLEGQKASEIADIQRQIGQPVHQSTVSDVGPQMPTRPQNERERMALLLRGMSIAPEQFQAPLAAEQWQQGMEDKQAAREEALAARREQLASNEALARDRMAQDAALRREMMGNQKALAAMNIEARKDMAAAIRAGKEGAGGVQWKYDAGSDTWVAPPTAQYPQGIVTASPQKAKSAENFNYLANKMLGTKEDPGPLYTTTTGGWLGLGGTIGKVTDTQGQKRFNNIREQLSTELRTIFRIPGEGALSDKEQAQYGIQLPEVGNDAAVNEAIMKDLQYRINNKTASSSNPLTPQPPAAGGAASSGNVIRYDAQGRRIQ